MLFPPRVETKMGTKRGIVASFSGLDGAGKSTQIEHLRSALEAQGYKVRLLAFWDNVVVFSRAREGFVHGVYGSERGVGAPGAPAARHDKNVRRWYLNLGRHALYFADAVHLAWVAGRARCSADVAIFDRYIYDEWANLPLRNPLTRCYVRLVRKLVPAPDVAFLLDVDPSSACVRKPEYPIEFMQQLRQSYKELAVLLRTMTTIPPLPLEDTKRQVETFFWTMTGKLCEPRAGGTPLLASKCQRG
jgi:thymidylate kinase